MDGRVLTKEKAERYLLHAGAKIGEVRAGKLAVPAVSVPADGIGIRAWGCVDYLRAKHGYWVVMS